MTVCKLVSQAVGIYHDQEQAVNFCCFLLAMALGTDLSQCFDFLQLPMLVSLAALNWLPQPSATNWP